MGTKAPENFLFFVDVLMGGNQHLGQEGYKFRKVDLSVFISVQFLERFVNGGLIFGVLERDVRDSELTLCLPFLQTSHPLELGSGRPGDINPFSQDVLENPT